MTTYSENDVQAAVDDYRKRHGLTRVDVCVQVEGEGDDGPIIGFRLSPGDGTGCAGMDERFGAWGQ